MGGWTGAQFAEKRLPTVSELNAAAPDTPVLVLHLYQSAILDRGAIAALGYTKDTPDPPGGQIVRDHAGNPTGVLLATPAPFILYGVLDRLPVLELSADYINVDDADISGIESVLTIVGRKIVWSSAEFEGLAAPLPAPVPAWSPVTEFGGFRNPAFGVGWGATGPTGSPRPGGERSGRHG